MAPGRSAPLVFAMITTRASRAYTPLALRSFFEHTPDRVIDRFLLIDNDGSFDAEGPAGDLTIVRPPAPRGFAQNANAALDEARARRTSLCLLNNDLIFTAGWFEPLLEDRRALVAPVSNAQVTYDIDGWITKPGMDVSDYAGHEAQLEELARRHRAAHQGFQRVAAVPFYAITIPSSVYEKVGAFDERFGPAGAEDRDYTVRAWIAGIPQELALGSYVLHFQGKSTWRGAEIPFESEARNRRYIKAFEEKWGPALSRAFLYEDWGPFRSDPRLARLIADGQYTPVVRHLRSHPSLAPFVERLSVVARGMG